MKYTIDRPLLASTGPLVTRLFHVLPYREMEGRLIFLADEAEDGPALCECLGVFMGREVALESCDRQTLDELIATYVPGDDATDHESFDPITRSDPTLLLLEAERLGASDIHIEPGRSHGRIRLRIDGRLIESHHIPHDVYPALVNRVKMAAGLDIAEKRLPQDGRMTSGSLDVRLNCLPSLHGEKMALRLLRRERSQLRIEDLGMPDDIRKAWWSGAQRSWGLILVSGPTGSGKTTTLYATLRELYSADIHIMTVEDPVEYRLDGITQVQVHEAIGRGFPAVLRSFLRQDPDIIMLGEIRDAETARIAVRAALTGHLVLSTIHTNSAAETVSRLTDMGIEPYLLAGTLNASLAQRLVRKLCPACRIELSGRPVCWPAGLSWPSHNARYFEPLGCGQCHYTGFQGRVAIFELLVPDAPVRERIRNGQALGAECVSGSISDHARELVASGITSPAEVLPHLNHGTTT